MCGLLTSGRSQEDPADVTLNTLILQPDKAYQRMAQGASFWPRYCRTLGRYSGNLDTPLSLTSRAFEQRQFGLLLARITHPTYELTFEEQRQIALLGSSQGSLIAFVNHEALRLPLYLALKSPNNDVFEHAARILMLKEPDWTHPYLTSRILQGTNQANREMSLSLLGNSRHEKTLRFFIRELKKEPGKAMRLAYLRHFPRIYRLELKPLLKSYAQRSPEDAAAASLALARTGFKDAADRALKGLQQFDPLQDSSSILYDSLMVYEYYGNFTHQRELEDLQNKFQSLNKPMTDAFFKATGSIRFREYPVEGKCRLIDHGLFQNDKLHLWALKRIIQLPHDLRRQYLTKFLYQFQNWEGFFDALMIIESHKIPYRIEYGRFILDEVE